MYEGERFNAISHLIGLILAVAGGTMLIIKASTSREATKIVAASIYVATLVILYLGSTLYHSFRNPKIKGILQQIDHCAIYLLIAGSYTPFCLVTLEGPWGWSILGVVWFLAIVGIIQDLTLGKRDRRLSLVIYALMGWVVVVAMKPLFASLEAMALFLLILGGVVYSAGIYWYVNDEKIRHGHGIWHLFVIGGSLFQFLCIYFYVA